MDTRPLTPRLGTTVHGLDLSGGITDEEAAELWSLLLDRAVLVIPEQVGISRDDHVTFARRFGTIERSPSGEATHPDVVRIVHGPQAPPTENIWHQDMSFRQRPLLGSVLRAVEIPPVGGDTLFADMRAVWDDLNPKVQAVVLGLRATHDISKWAAPELADELRAVAAPVDHPVVRVHPDTGRPVLNVNHAYTRRLIGLDESASRAMLDYLFSRVTVPEVQVRIRWEPGTVVLWDNRSVQHYATADYHPAVRIMERVTISGGPVEAYALPG